MLVTRVAVKVQQIKFERVGLLGNRCSALSPGFRES
jgi:hypothetical protein